MVKFEAIIGLYTTHRSFISKLFNLVKDFLFGVLLIGILSTKTRRKLWLE